MTKFKTSQEEFWAGEFGVQYLGRNPDNFEFGSRASLFSKILSRTEKVNSFLELGANIGNNLKALHLLTPKASLAAVEINAKAVEELKDWGAAKIWHQSILDFDPSERWDFTFVSGVLIHINPNSLIEVYKRLYQTSSRYLCLIEYYNPTPVEIDYREHSGKLFKRDFCSEIMDQYPDLKLLDYGFVYHRDNNFPLDDLTWFLLEKR